MNIRWKRTIAQIVSSALILIQIPVSADENVILETSMETKAVELEMQEGKEPALYSVTLPWYEECSYVFDTEKMVMPENEEKDITLLYEADEVVEISLQRYGEYMIDSVRVYTNEEKDIEYVWTESDTIEFIMPDNDVWLEMSFVTPVTEPVQTEPIETEQVQTEPVQIELMQTEPVQTEPVQTELAQTEPVHTESVQTEPMQTESVQIEPVQTESIQTETAQNEPVQSESVQTELIQTEQVPMEPVQLESEQTESVQLEQVQTEAVQTEPVQAEPVQTESVQTEPIQTEPPLKEGYAEETEHDGLPLQGSIVSMDAITIPFDTWDFDPYNDFRNITYDMSVFTIEYISDDIIYDTPGVYSSIYRVNDTSSDKFWFVLRPVRVADETEYMPPMEAEINDAESETLDVPETAGSEELLMDNETDEIQTESVNDFPAETETESGSEIETETEIVPEKYMVNAAASSEYSYEFDREDMEYEAGEEVTFSVDLADNYSMLSLEAETGIAGAKGENTDTEHVEVEQESADTFSFIMPEDDVTISLEAESGVMTLLASEEDPVPDKFKLIVKEIRFAPDSLTNFVNGVAIAASTFKQVKFLDGSDTVTRTAYCIQPKAQTPGTGTVYDKDKAVALDSSSTDEKNMAKCLYYLYPGPAWGKRIDYANGKDSVNLKTVMTNAGCTTKEAYYVLTHYIISYFYVGADDYNYNSNMGPALNSAGQKLVEDVAAHIKKLPIPRTKLDKTEVTSTYDSATGVSTSETVYYNSLEDNTATIHLPEGITLVNETQGTSGTGNVTINGKDHFHLETSTVTGTGSYRLSCKFPVDFTAFKLGLSGMQDIGFSYYSGDKTIDLKVTWIAPDVPENGYVQMQKLDSVTTTAQPLNADYSLAGAEYTVYADAGLTEAITVLITDATGASAAMEVAPRAYYVKETKASPGYELDQSIHEIYVTEGQTASFTSYEPPIRKPIEIQKVDSGTGQASPSNAAASFAGAEYTIYADSGCTQVVEVLTTNANGYAKSSVLPVAAYYVKETKAPTGYLPDQTVHTVNMSFTDNVPVYTVTSKEPIIRKPIELQKVDKETGKTAPVNEAASFEDAEYTIYSDFGCTKAVEVMKTNANGYAKSSELQIGTYYVKETKAPIGYLKDETVHTVDMSYTDNISVYKVTSLEDSIKESIELQKIDKETGKTVPSNAAASFAGAEYTIYSDSGCTKAVEVMKTDENGYAKSSPLQIGTYYVKETKVPTGYLKDETVHTVNMSYTDSISVYKVTSKEQIIKKPIELQKIDAETGKAVPANTAASFASAEYTIYSDSSCTKAVEVIKTDVNGYAKSSPLQIGTYYVKETKAPLGYLPDEIIYTVDMSYTDSVSIYKVTSKEQIIKEPIELQKVDKETGKNEPYNSFASFTNAEYTVYADAECKIPVETMKTNSKGYAKSAALQIGTYYVKETKAPLGYLPDETIYTVDMSYTDQIDVYPVTSEEQVIRKPIEIQKKDKDTGAEAANNSAVSFAGAEYTIYSDADCTKKVEVLTTDASGYAKSSDLVLGIYYIKETKAPAGYMSDETIMKIDIMDDGEALYRYESVEPVIRGSLSIMKYLDDNYDESVLQDRIENGDLKDISFILTHEDESVPEIRITTDKYGYAATEKDALVYGLWYINEDPETTPDGYQSLENASVMISEHGVEVKYVVTNKPYEAMLRVVKKDAVTGNAVSVSGGKFQLLDEEGNAISMPDHLNYSKLTDTFSLDENGEIFFTRVLLGGTYTVKEIEAPDGYLVAEPITFEVTENKTYEEPLVIECSDMPQMGRITVKKTDADTGETVGAGFAFAVYAAEDIADAGGALRKMVIDGVETELTKGTQIAIIETDETGTAETPELYLGKYLLKEVTSGEYYALDGTEHEIMLTPDNSVQSVNMEKEIRNEKTSLDIFKIDSDSTAEQEIFLSGIHFRIFTAQELDSIGGVVDILDREKLSQLGTEYITDENGHIHVENLMHDTVYYIFESETLPGYNLVSSLYKFSVDENGLIDGKPSYSIKISNTANLVEITKKDLTGERELPGATLTIYDSEGTVVETWVSEETPHTIKGLAAGTYTLVEEQAPAGYAVAESITFTLTDSLQVQQITMYDELIQVEVSKKDITDGEELPGAELTIADSDGNIVEQWISTDQPHMVNLAAGKYTLTEVAAPDKYATAETIEFEVTDTMEVQKVEMFDAPLMVEISKKDITTQEELPGAKLTVTDSEGNLIEQWIYTDQPHMLNLNVGRYTLTEIAAPDKYATAETIEFEVTDTMEIQKVEMFDTPLMVEISKKDITTQKELPGAELTIMDSEGNLIEQWISTDQPHMVNLAAGKYMLTEIAVPDKYATAETIEFEVTDTMEIQKVEMFDAPLMVEISKKDITTQKELPGAELTITDSEGNLIEQWISTDQPHMVNLAAGKYTLTEISAPDKYATAETIEFAVTGTMEVQKMEMFDAPLMVEISKKDITTQEELPGAELTITDSEGNLIEQWISTDKPHMVSLSVGNYILTEIAAPSGYVKAESIEFEVTDTMEVQKVEMFDKLIEVSISKKDITNEEELPGAQLIIKDSEGNTVEEWESMEKPHLINLPAGDYTLTEVTAPFGYEVAETIYFTVTDSMEVQHVTMYDAPKEETVDLTGKEDIKTTTTGGTPTVSGNSNQNIITSAVATGDFNRYFPAIIISGAGGVLMVLYMVMRKKRK